MEPRRVKSEKSTHTLRDMVDNVFLHRKVATTPDDVQLAKTELCLLNALTRQIESFESEIFPLVVQRLFSNMKKLHCIDVLDPKEISKQITSLRLGDMFGMYVREQNCGLFIHMASDDEATLSTFQASLPNEVIYGDKINGDIQVNATFMWCGENVPYLQSFSMSQVDYPSRSIKVKLSTILKSEEFAKQLVDLNHTPRERAMAKVQKVGREFDEVRNARHPQYVSQWLMAAASNRSTEAIKECRVISKKMRDEIIKGDQKLPFRRSGFYIAMKVILQLGLTIQLGEERGHFLYKLTMLKFMRPSYNQVIDDDIAMQMLAKLARRMDKIENRAASANNLGNDLICVKNDVITASRKTIRSVRGHMDKKFAAIQADELKKSNLKKLPRLHFEQDIIHQMPKTLEYIGLRKAKREPNSVDDSPKLRQIIRHQWFDKGLPDVNKLKRLSYAGDTEVLLLLGDIEHWVLEVLDQNYPELQAPYLRELATAYMSKAQTFYENDGFGYSRMVLAMLKIIQVIHTHCTVSNYGIETRAIFSVCR